MSKRLEDELQINAFNPELWNIRARKYDKLSWVNATDPMNHMLELAKISGSEMVVDVGTGSQAVKKAIEPRLTSGGRVLAFDISQKMLALGKNGKYQNDDLFLACALNIPLQSEVADVVTARMVYHHMPDPVKAVKEAGRIIKPGGKMIIGEHVAYDKEVLEFERKLLQMKEPDRQLWTPKQLAYLVESTGIFSEVYVEGGLIPQYSIRNWLDNSGLPEEIIKKVLAVFEEAPETLSRKLNINITKSGDVFMDGHYAYVVGVKAENDGKTAS